MIIDIYNKPRTGYLFNLKFNWIVVCFSDIENYDVDLFHLVDEEGYILATIDLSKMESGDLEYLFYRLEEHENESI